MSVPSLSLHFESDEVSDLCIRTSESAAGAGSCGFRFFLFDPSRSAQAARAFLLGGRVSAAVAGPALLAHFHHQNPHLTFFFLHQEQELVIL